MVMFKLKGACFLTAFLTGHLFPVFLAAAELPVYKKYEGSIKPGVVITKENFDTYLPELQKLFPPARLKWCSHGVKEGLITIPIAKTIYHLQTKGQLEATRKYAGTARIGADNQLYNYVAGLPFPEPTKASEIARNVDSNLSRAGAHDDFFMGHAFFAMFQGTKYEKHFVWDLFDRKYRGRMDIPPLGDMPEFTDRGVGFKESIIIYEPNEVRGFIQLRIRYWDINKVDDSYAYIPALRRVRRLTGADLTDPLLGSDAANDDFDTWRQKIDSKMTFRVLEHRDFLVPKTYTELEENRPEWNYKKTGPFFQTEWEIRPLWVLEIMINDPDYIYSKRVVYIDSTPPGQGGRYVPYWGEMYDQKGRLWKAGSCTGRIVSNGGFESMLGYIWMNCQTGHYTSMSGRSPYLGKDFNKNFPLDEDAAFSIKGLLKRVR